MATFAENITALRKKQNKKRQEVADDLGISRSSLEYYEKNKRKPDIEVLTKIADYYGVSADYLLGRTNAKTTDKDLRFICEYTGLSENAITTLSELHDPVNVLNVVPAEIVPLIDFLINDMGVRLTDEGCAYRHGAILPRLSDYLRCVGFGSKQEVFVTQDGKIFESKEKAHEEAQKLSMDINKIYSANAADLAEAAFYKLLTDAIASAKERYRGN